MSLLYTGGFCCEWLNYLLGHPHWNSKMRTTCCRRSCLAAVHHQPLANLDCNVHCDEVLQKNIFVHWLLQDIGSLYLSASKIALMICWLKNSLWKIKLWIYLCLWVYEEQSLTIIFWYTHPCNFFEYPFGITVCYQGKVTKNNQETVPLYSYYSSSKNSPKLLFTSLS